MRQLKLKQNCSPGSNSPSRWRSLMSSRPSLESLVVRNFRSIAGEWTIPLDASVVLIHGDNGAGKTSLLSAIELAATGQVSYLHNAGDRTYQKHLVHRGTADSFVELTTRSDIGANTKTGRFTLSDHGADGKALLAAGLAQHFGERCMLSQVTLGRLLDVYAPQDQKQQESSLIRFVKELLGLDVLDELIDGLASTTRMDIARKRSRLWMRFNDEYAKSARKLKAVQDRLTELKKEAEETQQAVLAHTGDDGDAVAVTSTSLMELTASQHRTNEKLQSELTAVFEHSTKLNAISLLVNSFEVADADSGGLSLEALDRQVIATEERLAKWWRTKGRSLKSFFDEAVDLLDRSADWDQKQATLLCARAEAQLRETGKMLEDFLERASELQARLDSNREKFNKLVEVSESLQARKEAIATSLLSGQMSQVLTQTLNSLQSDGCPVCDQNYPGGENQLRLHIESKLQRLNNEARLWADLDSASRGCANEMEQLTSDIGRQEEGLASAHDISEARAKRSRLRGLLARVPQLNDLLAEVTELQQSSETVTLKRSAAAAKASLSEQIEELLTATARDLGDEQGAAPGNFRSRTKVLTARATEERLRLEELLEKGNEAKRRLIRHLDAKEALDAALADHRKEEEQRSVLRQQLAEAERRKDAAFDLRKEAERLRSEVINSVFDKQLNRTWESIFSRLVPDEPFIPQFEKQIKQRRSASVNLTTKDKDGGPAGTPSAMLSYGNVNTAALSLFLSLHFVAKNELPWLILDDPVQSMDDVHIANFAALLKRVIREEKRQVIIAVHQRELFDYLALELTPAREGEHLIAVEVQRDRHGTRIEVQRQSYVAETALEISVA